MTGIDIEVAGIAKRYGAVDAVRDVSFTAPAGHVTGLVGANGAGKSTTMRMLLGLVRADAGTARFGAIRYTDLADPSGTVGAVLDLASPHPAMTARGHLRTYAALGGHPARRADEVAEATGLTEYADRRIRGFSTGMRQRLSLATALLGDPGVLVLDEPSNGLDPAGIAWLRAFLREFADRGGTVLISSHQLAELEHIVDRVVLVDRGRTVWDGTRAQLAERADDLESLFFQLTTMEESA
jgi:ABC-2 type transport system ATP-binding protein